MICILTYTPELPTAVPFLRVRAYSCATYFRPKLRSMQPDLLFLEGVGQGMFVK